MPDGVVSPITALWVDGGRSPTGYGRVSDPALTAATVFADALSRAGIQVVGAPGARCRGRRQRRSSPPSRARR